MILRLAGRPWPDDGQQLGGLEWTRQVLPYPEDSREATSMRIEKQELLKLMEDLPEQVEVDEVFYRLYLREKLTAAEEDVEAGRVLSHEEVTAETAKWFLG
jgi:hypothetical protein